MLPVNAFPPQERTSLKAEIAAGLRYAWSDVVDRPGPDLPRRVRCDRRREPDRALLDLRRAHPAGLGGGGFEPDGPFPALRRAVRVA